MKFNQIKNKGFTLIEIMVVVTIIGILAAILFVNFDDARKQARDKVRMTSLKEMQLSLELYKSQYGRYPDAGCSAASFSGPGPVTGGGFTSCNTNYVDAYTGGGNFVPDFITFLPIDPKFELEANRGFYYRTDATGAEYKLIAHDVAEVLLIAGPQDDFSRCPVAAGCPDTFPSDTYAIYSGSNAAQW
jgi:prepilin-type N-terminal cleavage/methylation domain-containing protein